MSIREQILNIIVQIQNGDGATIDELPEKGIEKAFLEQEADQILSTIKGALPFYRYYEQNSYSDWYERNKILDSEDGFNKALREINDLLSQ